MESSNFKEFSEHKFTPCPTILTISLPVTVELLLLKSIKFDLLSSHHIVRFFCFFLLFLFQVPRIFRSTSYIPLEVRAFVRIHRTESRPGPSIDSWSIQCELKQFILYKFMFDWIVYYQITKREFPLTLCPLFIHPFWLDIIFEGK